MAELIHQFPDPVRSAAGVPYVAQVWGEGDARWSGWLVFIAVDGHILRTVRSTPRSNRDAVRRWALGLRPAHLSRALARAIPASEALPAA
jgi:hypothetical protein